MSPLLLDDFDVRIRKSKNKQSNEQQQKLKDKQEENANFRSEHLIPFKPFRSCNIMRKCKKRNIKTPHSPCIYASQDKSKMVKKLRHYLANGKLFAGHVM